MQFYCPECLWVATHPHVTDDTDHHVYCDPCGWRWMHHQHRPTPKMLPFSGAQPGVSSTEGSIGRQVRRALQLLRDPGRQAG